MQITQQKQSNTGSLDTNIAFSELYICGQNDWQPK